MRIFVTFIASKTITEWLQPKRQIAEKAQLNVKEIPSVANQEKELSPTFLCALLYYA